MDYRVVITTSGRKGLLERTLAAFDYYVRPRPTEGLIVDDSGDLHYRRWLEAVCNERGWQLVSHPVKRGFCETVADAWNLASDPTFTQSPWVFWLEDDFELRRPVDLSDLATVLYRQPHVAQMSLLRGPENEAERRAGGVVQANREAFALRGGGGSMTWLEHRLYWTTNPSLFHREVAEQCPWPVEDECEGKFKIALLELNPRISFGVWGAGDDPWVDHIGRRDGFGY